MTHQLVEAVGLRRLYGKGPSARAAIDGVDLTVDAGEFVALVGPSGSGKSTLLSILGGLDTAFSGTVRLLGKRLETMSDAELARLRGAHLGFVFQAFHLLDHLTVLDNVMVPFLFTPTHHAEQRARSALERVGLEGRLHDRTATLSGGQRQRVAIARAIAHEPALLFCDEPTGNLDRDTAAQVIDLFVQLNRERGTTVVCATHDEAIARRASRTVHLREGKLLNGAVS